MVEGSRTWHGVLSAIWLVLLVVWFLITTIGLVDQGKVPESADLAAWIGLVLFQMMIWAAVAFLNLGVASVLGWAGVRWWEPVVFVLAVWAVIGLPVGVVSIYLGVQIFGSVDTQFVGTLLQAGALISVIPALLVVYLARAKSLTAEPDPTAASVENIHTTRRSMRFAIGSLGVTIGVAIITTSYIRSVLAEVSDTFSIGPEHIMFYGGFFTAVLFVLYIYAKSAVDDTAKSMVDRAAPATDMSDVEAFIETETTRAELGMALGLGVSAREGFENLVIVAAPLLSALLTTFVSAG